MGPDIVMRNCRFMGLVEFHYGELGNVLARLNVVPNSFSSLPQFRLSVDEGNKSNGSDRALSEDPSGVLGESAVGHLEEPALEKDIAIVELAIRVGVAVNGNVLTIKNAVCEVHFRDSERGADGTASGLGSST